MILDPIINTLIPSRKHIKMKGVPWSEFAIIHWQYLMTKEPSSYYSNQCRKKYEKFVDSCQQKMGLSHKGTMYPDWRYYSLGDVSFNFFPDKLSSRADWLQVNDLLDCIDDFKVVSDTYKELDIVETFSVLRSILFSDDVPLSLKVSSILKVKYLICCSPIEDFELFLPIYLSISSKFIKSKFIWGRCLGNNRFWVILSTFHLFPREVEIININTFDTPLDWFLLNKTIILNSLWT